MYNLLGFRALVGNTDDTSENVPVKLTDLYALAYAPLGATLLEDLEDLSADDFTPEALYEELKYLKEFSTAISLFDRYFRTRSSDQNREDTGVAMYCLNAYLKRVQGLATALAEMTGETVVQFGDVMPRLKEMEASIKTGSLPDSSYLKNILNLTPNMRWESPETVGRGKVGFKDKTLVIGPEDNVSSKQKEEPLKVDQVRRTQRRHPTGFNKFSFKAEDLDLEDSDDGGSTRISRSRFDSDDQRSARSTGTCASSVPEGVEVRCTELPADTEGGEDDLEESNCFNPFREGKRSSSVGFSFEKAREIEDAASDPHWHDRNRHEKRFSRIRNRVPTGHPTIMKTASDDLHDLLAEYDKQAGELGDDEETTDNTEKNKATEVREGDELRASRAEFDDISVRFRSINIIHKE